MFVRLSICLALAITSLAHADAPEQVPTFTLTVKQPVGGKPDKYKAITDSLAKLQATLEPKLFAITKAEPKSRLNVTISVEVSPTGAFVAKGVKVNFRTADKSITSADAAIKKACTEAVAKATKVTKDAAGTTDEVTIAILQP